MCSIKENLEQVKKNIKAACERSGRDTSSVTLISVSKTKPVSKIKEAIEAGAHIFGENKAQEMRDKSEVLPDNLEWHFIGHLQTNKVKYVVGRAKLIHSVDSLHLAEEINKESIKKNVISDILIEVNVAQEDTKFGVSVENTLSLVEDISKLSNIHVKGLMTIAPYTSNPEENRKFFRKLSELAVDIRQKNIDNIDMGVLSMGMTGDYEVAIEEGATYVRVGTGIFGERDYGRKENLIDG